MPIKKKNRSYTRYRKNFIQLGQLHRPPGGQMSIKKNFKKQKFEKSVLQISYTKYIQNFIELGQLQQPPAESPCYIIKK